MLGLLFIIVVMTAHHIVKKMELLNNEKWWSKDSSVTKCENKNGHFLFVEEKWMQWDKTENSDLWGQTKTLPFFFMIWFLITTL